jgi:hypothetical protein
MLHRQDSWFSGILPFSGGIVKPGLGWEPCRVSTSTWPAGPNLSVTFPPRCRWTSTASPGRRRPPAGTRSPHAGSRLARVRGDRAAPYDLVLVQIGVGTLASAVVAHYRRLGLAERPALIGVEPTGAACVLQPIEVGRPVMIRAGVDESMVAGLNCGTPHRPAWPFLRDGMEGSSRSGRAP